MSANDHLPVILVSAVDAATASVIIKELINDGNQPQCNGVSHENDDEPHLSVWHLSNKYYSAFVRLYPLPEDAAPNPDIDVQAHIIYLTEDECTDATVCARRATAAHASRHGVRLVAARTDREPPALAAWARTSYYELVPLLAPPVEGDGEPFAETTGVARLREALHAHAWPGMRRAGAVRAPAPDLHDDSSHSSSSSWGSWTGANEAEAEAGAVERAEQFVDALALLPARRAVGQVNAVGEANDAGEVNDAIEDNDVGEDDAVRRLHAEQLVVAFCRALGHDLNLDGDL